MIRFLAFVAVALLVPAEAFAQFGPIVPEVCRTCPCGFGGVMAIIQNVMNLIISVAIIFATFLIAWAGFTFITGASNAEKRGQASKMLINAAIGLVIVLSAWMLVDFVMKSLYGGQFGPWNSILSDGIINGAECIVAKPNKALFSGDIVAIPGVGSDWGSGSGVVVDPGTLEGGADGQFTYQEGIQAQRDNASPALEAMLRCMANKVPANVGQISSITAKGIESGQVTMAYCAANGSARNAACAHTANSCHFGGRTCVGQSYAVDFGDEGNSAALIRAANLCGAKNAGIHNNNHVHVTVENNCGCS